MTLVLCGMPCCGKTTFGKRVAETMKCSFVDTDRLVEDLYLQETGSERPCRDIYRVEGEAFFRSLETMALMSLTNEGPAVVAVGGGMLAEQGNRDAVKKMGTVVYLKASLEVLWERICRQGTLPAYLDDDDPKGSLELLALRRTACYEEAADVVIDTGLYGQEIVLARLYKHLSTGR